MQRGVWPALNPLSIHVTFTTIVPGAYPGEAKKCKNVLKWRTFELTGWITGKQLKIDGYMLRCFWQALNPIFIHVKFTAIVSDARPKCALHSLTMPPPAKWVKATTYRRDSPEVAKLCLKAHSHYVRYRTAPYVVWRQMPYGTVRCRTVRNRTAPYGSVRHRASICYVNVCKWLHFNILMIKWRQLTWTAMIALWPLRVISI